MTIKSSLLTYDSVCDVITWAVQKVLRSGKIYTLIFIVNTTFGIEKLHFLTLITKAWGFAVIFVPSALKFKLNMCSFVFEGRVQFKITMNSVARTLAIYIYIYGFSVCHDMSIGHH